MSADGAILGGVPQSSRSEFKQGMKYMSLVGGSCFMLACIAATITNTTSVNPSDLRTSDADHANSVNPSVLKTSDADHATNLVSMSGVSRLPSGGAVKPASMQSMRAPVVLGSGPFRKSATSPTEVSNFQNMRDIKVRQRDASDDRQKTAQDARMDASRKLLRGMDLKTPESQARLDRLGVEDRITEAVIEEDEEKPKEIALLIGFMFISLIGLGASTLAPQTFN